MPAIEVDHVSYTYGRVEALHDVTFSVPEGALYALLGPNGSGKTTLLQILLGVRRVRAGSASLLGSDSRALTVAQRRRIAYVSEGLSLPRWMTLEQLEAYVAPLYPTWDRSLAMQLQGRFALDPTRRIGTLSRGERMKAAVLCALAPRPKVLLMDEPFTGMDAVVKDDLVRGLLESAGSEGWTVLIASHDIGELELLADWVGFLQGGRMRLSEPMDGIRERFKRVTIIGGGSVMDHQSVDASWLGVERAGRRLTFLTARATDDRNGTAAELRRRFADADQIEIEDASLREIFVALARSAALVISQEVAA